MEIVVEYCLNITFYVTLRVPAAPEKAEAGMAHSLPASVRDIQSLPAFRQKLKLTLFSDSFAS